MRSMEMHKKSDNYFQIMYKAICLQNLNNEELLDDKKTKLHFCVGLALRHYKLTNLRSIKSYAESEHDDTVSTERCLPEIRSALPISK